MNESKSSLHYSAVFMVLCSVFQVTLPLLLGFNMTAYQMVFLGLLGLVTAFGLFKGWRWLAYMAFLPVLVVVTLAMARSFDVIGLASGWYMGIAVFDLLTGITLFMALWRAPEVL